MIVRNKNVIVIGNRYMLAVNFLLKDGKLSNFKTALIKLKL